MPRARLCPRCGNIIPPNDRYCERHQAEHDLGVIRRTRERQAVRQARDRETGRTSAHWRRIRDGRKRLDDYRCQLCGGYDDLTVHLDPSLEGNHWLATLDNCTTLCRRCHGANPSLAVISA